MFGGATFIDLFKRQELTCRIEFISLV